MKQTVKIPASTSIRTPHLFIAADCNFMGVLQRQRRYRYSAWPYLCYSFLHFLILGMLSTLHTEYARLNRKLWYTFLLADGILLTCFWKGHLLYPWEVLLMVVGVLLVQLWNAYRQLGQGHGTIDI